MYLLIPLRYSAINMCPSPLSTSPHPLLQCNQSLLVPFKCSNGIRHLNECGRAQVCVFKTFGTLFPSVLEGPLFTPALAWVGM